MSSRDDQRERMEWYRAELARVRQRQYWLHIFALGLAVGMVTTGLVVGLLGMAGWFRP